MFDKLFELLAPYGVGAIIAGICLYALWRILNSFMTGLKEDRDNYMKIIENQTVTKNNHIAHLDESIKDQGKEIAKQGERFTAGIDKLCDALESQTEVLKAYIHSKKG